jgi:hypothetical protein
MKKIIFILLTLITSFSVFSQNITGQWHGILKVQGIQLRIVFNITQTDNGYHSTMDSPDQGAKGIPVSTTNFDNSMLELQLPKAGIKYEGTLNKENTFVGTFNQGGQEFLMNLTRKATEKEVVNRPQEPSKPYPYFSEEVTFENKKEKIKLAGTLTLPKKEGTFPAVILISGSGPQNRDEELLGHKPFLILADDLTKKGIAVLRFDDRGTAMSTGDFKTATSADFATDVQSAVAYLTTRKEINQNAIGLIGHSEGGIIAPMVASKSKDVSFIVLLAGTGIQGNQLLLLQQELISKANGVSDIEIKKSIKTNKKLFEMVVNSNDSQKLKNDLTNKMNQLLKMDSSISIPNGMTKDEFISMQITQISSPWMQYFIKYNPKATLEKVKCPVLALNGEKDLQVPSKVNLNAIKTALKKGGNQKVTVKELPNLNHLFQECETGSPSEYATIEQTFSPIALVEISSWILKQVK